MVSFPLTKIVTCLNMLKNHPFPSLTIVIQYLMSACLAEFKILDYTVPLLPSCPCLKDYRQTHPEVTVLDPPDAIQHVHNRQSMLQDVADLNLSDSYGNFFPLVLPVSWTSVIFVCLTFN